MWPILRSTSYTLRAPPPERIVRKLVDSNLFCRRVFDGVIVFPALVSSTSSSWPCNQFSLDSTLLWSSSSSCSSSDLPDISELRGLTGFFTSESSTNEWLIPAVKTPSWRSVVATNPRHIHCLQCRMGSLLWTASLLPVTRCPSLPRWRFSFLLLQCTFVLFGFLLKICPSPRDTCSLVRSYRSLHCPGHFLP